MWPEDQSVTRLGHTGIVPQEPEHLGGWGRAEGLPRHFGLHLGTGGC